MLLRFRVVNHRSLRDEAELSLVSSALRTRTPPDGDWVAVTLRVAAIYGANAAGKSTVISAMDFALSAVRYSATRWAEIGRFPQEPFRLDPESAERPSEYEFDFVMDSTRYNYGFTTADARVATEWLYAYPNGRRKRLFERTGSQTYSFGRDLPGENVRISQATRPSTLFLSSAANVQHPFLDRIQRHLTDEVTIAPMSRGDQIGRLAAIKEMIETDPAALAQATALLRMADVGISDVSVTERKGHSDLDAAFDHLISRIAEATRSERPDLAAFTDRRQLSFGHMTASGFPVAITENYQSSGTLAWLSLALPALVAFRTGEALVVDELSASLHPRLSGALLTMFKDPTINRAGAQLIFTTHDTSYLSGAAGVRLEPDEIWFVEKDTSGASQVFPLSDFSTRSADNYGRRYLDGRYGAVPVVDLDELRELLAPTAQ